MSEYKNKINWMLENGFKEGYDRINNIKIYTYEDFNSNEFEYNEKEIYYNSLDSIKKCIAYLDGTITEKEHSKWFSENIINKLKGSC